MPPRTPRIADATRASIRSWQSNWRRRAVRSGNRTAARRRSNRPIWEDPAWHPPCGPALYLFDHNAVDLVCHIIEAIGDFLEMIIDLGADDEIHGVGVPVFKEQLLQPDVMEVVNATLQLGEFFGNRRQHRHVLA